MAIFITYARKDRAAVDALARDLDRSHNAVWLDNELTGGQAWWDTILSQIRTCDIYVFALSPESLKSRACRLELEYAVACGRPLLPVQIADVFIAHAPRVIANTQIVDYRTRTVDSGIALIAAVSNQPRAAGLPDPLPDPPPPPMSYMNEYRELVDAESLSYQQQSHLLVDLRGYLGQDEDDAVPALELLRALRARRDIAEGIGREIDEILRKARPVQQPPVQQAPAQQAPAQQPPNYPQAPVYQPPAADPYATSAPSANPYGPANANPYAQPTPPVYQPTPPPVNQPVEPTFPVYNPVPHQPQPVPSPGPTPGGDRSHPQGTLVLVLGILSLVICPITGIFAGVMGSRVLKEMDAQPGRYDGRSTVNLGRILGWVGFGFWTLFGVIYLLIVAAAASQSSY